MATTQGMLVELLDLEGSRSTSSEAAAPTRTCSASSAARWPARLSSPPDGLYRRTVLCTRYMPTSSGPAIPISRSSIPSTASDGRSFTTRRVVAVQHGRAIFALSASFQVAETGPQYQSLMPEAPDPETEPVWQERLKEYGDQVPARWLRPRPVEVRYVGDPPWQAQAVGGPREPRTMVWLRASETLPDDPLLHVCAVTYASDLTLLDAVLLGSGLAWDEHRVTGASLDHAMWFHAPFRADDWLLYLQESPPHPGRVGWRAARSSGVTAASSARSSKKA
jgi:acyl-CoA thioesterase-2